MSHSSQKRWNFVAGIAEEACQNLVDVLLDVESKYQDLLELYSFAGSSAQGLADLLFKEEWEGREEAQANADEVAKCADLIAAMTSVHGLYQAADDQAVTQEDRFLAMRRFT